MRSHLLWLAMVGLVAFSPACRVIRHGEWSRRDICAQTLPLLRTEPTRPYRVVKVLEADNDDEMVWEACAEHADAVVALGLSGGTTTQGVAVGGKIGFFSGKTSPSDKVSGVAIRYESAAEGEPASQ